jgi:hypothetical protein
MTCHTTWPVSDLLMMLFPGILVMANISSVFIEICDACHAGASTAFELLFHLWTHKTSMPCMVGGHLLAKRSEHDSTGEILCILTSFLFATDATNVEEDDDVPDWLKD